MVVVLFVPNAERNHCAALCVPQREHGEINNGGLTAVPGGYLRANLLKKDPASERLIPSDKNTKLIFSYLQKCSTSPGFVPFTLPISKVIGGASAFRFTTNMFYG